MTTSPIEDSATLHCEERIGTEQQPSEGLEVVEDVVALPEAGTFGPLQAEQNAGDDNPQTRLFAKQGLEVRANESFDLIVPDEDRDHLVISWGNAPATYTWELHVSCDDPTAEWIIFAGGYFVPEEKCVSLIVRSGGKEERVPIGVGTSCTKN